MVVTRDLKILPTWKNDELCIETGTHRSISLAHVHIEYRSLGISHSSESFNENHRSSYHAVSSMLARLGLLLVNSMS